MEFVSILVRTDNLMYLVYDDEFAISIDSFEPDIIDKALSCVFHKTFYTKCELINLPSRTNKRKLIASLTTHSHYDHAGGDSRLKRIFPDIIQYSGFYDNPVNDGQVINIKNFVIECIDTKCHTLDSFCFYINKKWLFTGDTVFFLGCGKFFEGTGQQMLEALQKIKKRVDENTLVLYGHDYRKNNVAFQKTINENLLTPYKLPEGIEEKMFLTLKEEIEYNPFFRIIEINGGDSHPITELRKAKDNYKH